MYETPIVAPLGARHKPPPSVARRTCIDKQPWLATQRAPPPRAWASRTAIVRQGYPDLARPSEKALSACRAGQSPVIAIPLLR